MIADKIAQVLRREVARCNATMPESVDFSLSLAELGVDSLGYVDIAVAIGQEFNYPLQPETLFEHISLQASLDFLIAEIASSPETTQESRTSTSTSTPQSTNESDNNNIAAPEYSSKDIAIIGMALRMPGAHDAASWWQLLTSGQAHISDFPKERLAAVDLPSDASAEFPSYLRGGFLHDVAGFDAAFFGISPREAIAMDAQQRLLMECAWQTLEDAAYPPEQLSGSDTAVFIGVSNFDYYELLLKTGGARTTHIGTGVSHAILANRLSQYFNLKGASEAIDSACASSLVALMRAVRTLQHGESKMALVGGVNLLASRSTFQFFADAGMLSKVARCLPFDDQAAGYVRGEGVACVLLKSAQQAVQDGDRILAIIKGGAVQHSGRTQSLTAPNPAAQADVIVAAMREAQIDPASIGYLEAHGTGTSLGDPIELQGLKKAYASLHQEWGRASIAPHCYLGSVKAQIGHLESCAGLAGVLKAVAVLSHGHVPALAHLRKINPLIDLQGSPFLLPRENMTWGTGEFTSYKGPRRAGVSSFGFGGTNAHVVLEQGCAPRRADAVLAKPRLFVISAKNEEALRQRCRDLCNWWQSHTEQPTSEQNDLERAAELTLLRDVAHTLQIGRSTMAFRAAIIATQGEEMSAAMHACANEGLAAANLDLHIWTGQRPRSAPNSSVSAAEIAAWYAQGELAQLASYWAAGGDVAWATLPQPEPAQRLALPGYPFQHEDYWPRFAPNNTVFVSNSAADNKVADEVVEPDFAAVARGAAYFHQRWHLAELVQSSYTPVPNGAVILLISAARGQLLARKLASLAPQVHWQRIACSATGNAMNSTSAKHHLQAVIDLTALDASHPLTPSAKLALLQSLIGSDIKRGTGLQLLQICCGMQEVRDDEGKLLASSSNLSGAPEVGFYSHFQAEYKRCSSKSIDFSLFDPQFMAQQILAELAPENRSLASSSACYAYVQGQRWMRAQHTCVLPVAGPYVPLAKMVAFVTGGTGGIGLHVLRDLAAQGCRAMLVTGRSELAEEQKQVLDELRAQGVVLEIYRGELHDAQQLGACLAQFRAQHGVISHVLHCAGAADAALPAFYQKTAASMARVFAPKVSALNVLHDLFSATPPHAFILFSSVAAIAPKMAAGALDYCSANHYMDLFAQHQHAHGHHYYCSLQWTRWQNTGLARHAQEASGLAVAECLLSLRAILALAEQQIAQHRELLPANLCIMAIDEDPFANTATTPAMAGLAVQASAHKMPTTQHSAPTSAVNAQNAQHGQSAQAVQAAHHAPLSLPQIHSKLREMLTKELEIPQDKVEDGLSDYASFEALGIDSIVLMGLIAALESWLGVSLAPQEVIECDSIAALAQYLVAMQAHQKLTEIETEQPNQPNQANAQHANRNANPGSNSAHLTRSEQHNPIVNPHATHSHAPARSRDIAVVGMACHFPGAPDTFAFWQNLQNGIDSVREVPAGRWQNPDIYSPVLAPGRSVSRWGGFIDGMEMVDPKLFSMNDKEAADVDPLLRLFADCSLACAQDAPGGRAALKGKRVGVFVGARVGQYSQRIPQPSKHSVAGIGQNFIAAHVSHLLDLHGPSMVLDTACSSSLAAIHLACQSIASGDAEMALAGGVDVLLDEQTYLFLSASHALSPDGKCRTFDASANGFVPGEGAGCVLLKPLAQALADGDPVYAVISGSAMNNDGHTLGITTPAVAGQVDVIQRALHSAHLSSRDISYVEAHGTGTLIGDPIELQALARAFQAAPPNACGVGSVKTNIGHLLSAAGVASFIKVALSLHHQVLPPTLHCEQINPRFDFTHTPFYPVKSRETWQAIGQLHAGVSAFGFGKTNVHVVLSQAPANAQKPNLAPVPPMAHASHKVHAWHAVQSAPLRPQVAGPLLALREVVVEELAAGFQLQ